jgi:hypothetical protein
VVTTRLPSQNTRGSLAIHGVPLYGKLGETLREKADDNSLHSGLSREQIVQTKFKKVQKSSFQVLEFLTVNPRSCAVHWDNL